MTEQMLTQLFTLCYNACTLEERVFIHNLYVENNCDDEGHIYKNDDCFFNDLISDHTLFQIVKAICKGEYDCDDGYVWVDSFGYLKSAKMANEMPLLKPLTMADWFIKNNERLKSISVMGEFCDLCEKCL